MIVVSVYVCEEVKLAAAAVDATGRVGGQRSRIIVIVVMVGLL